MAEYAFEYPGIGAFGPYAEMPLTSRKIIRMQMTLLPMTVAMSARTQFRPCYHIKISLYLFAVNHSRAP
jgi:hypothetical protein